MTHRSFFLGALLLASFGALAQSPAAQHKSSALRVQVNYTGSGKVDASHKIWVSLWDTPDFAKGDTPITPIAVASITLKSGIATFGDVQKTPVYVGMVYDPTGKWDAQSEPPSGVSLGLYSKEPGVPAPIDLEPGKTTKVSADLDDSVKKP